MFLARIALLFASRDATFGSSGDGRRRRRLSSGLDVVPAFNEAVGIEKAIRSLDASEYPEFEIVVVDDGSADGTAELIEALGLPRVRFAANRTAASPRR